MAKAELNRVTATAALVAALVAAIAAASEAGLSKEDIKLTIDHMATFLED